MLRVTDAGSGPAQVRSMLSTVGCCEAKPIASPSFLSEQCAAAGQQGAWIRGGPSLQHAHLLHPSPCGTICSTSSAMQRTQSSSSPWVQLRQGRASIPQTT